VCLTAVVGFLFAFAGPASALSPEGAVLGAGAPSAIPGRYIVKLKDDAGATGMGVRARSLATGHGGGVRHVWEGLRSYSVSMSEEQARRLAADPAVTFVQQDQLVAGNRLPIPPAGKAAKDRKSTTASTPSPDAVQTPVSWGLDRIDQHARPLDNHYAYDDTAGGAATAYVLDTGIDLDHPDFGGRASFGADFINDGTPRDADCVGEGTAVAGAIGGQEFGVAKRVRLVSVRTLDCRGVGTLEAVLDGFNFVIANARRPAVAMVDLDDFCIDNNHQIVPCSPGFRAAVIAAEDALVGSGISVVANAGDHSGDACQRSSGAAPGAFYVGATTIDDRIMAASNFGSCLTMFAPGEAIPTDIPTGTMTFSSTTMAAALVTGTVALFAGKPEFAGKSPADIKTELLRNRSTPNVINGLSADSPNKLLYTGPPGLFTIGSSVSVVRTGTGKADLFGVDPASFIVRHEQTTAGGTSWTGPERSATRGWLSLSAANNANDRLQLVAINGAGELWQRQQAAEAGTWYNWSLLDRPAPGFPIGRAAMAYNHSNRLEIFVTNVLGQLFYRSQTSAGATTWTNWSRINFGGTLRSIAAVSNADGRIEVIGLDDAGATWRLAQTSPTDNNWSGLTRLDGPGMASLTATSNGDGRLELIGIDAGGNPWRRRQTAPGATTWDRWARLPSATLAQITAVTDSNGLVHLVGVDNLRRIWQSRQTGLNLTSYSPWERIDGSLRS
jgi:subtilisin family serine protease